MQCMFMLVCCIAAFQQLMFEYCYKIPFVRKSCRIVSINYMQVLDLPHCTITNLTVCMHMAEL